MIVASRREVVVGLGVLPPTLGLPKINTRVFVSYFHIVQIESLPAPAPPADANGAGG
jgi:hypothetical protein